MTGVYVDMDRYQCGGQTDAEYDAIDGELSWVKKAAAITSGLNRITTFVPRCWNCRAELAPKRIWLETATRSSPNTVSDRRKPTQVVCESCDESTYIKPLWNDPHDIVRDRIYIRSETDRDTRETETR